MEYITLDGTIVTEILSNEKPPETAITIPKDFEIQLGDDIRFFDAHARRITIEEAIKKFLIKPPNDKEAIVWTDGKYRNVADFRNVKFRDKKTKQIKQYLELGEKPDDSVTEKELPDDGAVWDWEKDDWVIPETIKEKNEKEHLQALFNRTNMESARPIRAILLGKGTQEDWDKLEKIERQTEIIRKKYRKRGGNDELQENDCG